MKIMRWPCQVLFYLPWLNIYPHRITIYKMWDNSTKWIYIYIKIFIFYSLMYNIHTSCKIALIDNHWLTLTTEIFLTIMEWPYTRCMMTLPCSLLFTLTIVVSHSIINQYSIPWYTKYILAVNLPSLVPLKARGP